MSLNNDGVDGADHYGLQFGSLVEETHHPVANTPLGDQQDPSVHGEKQDAPNSSQDKFISSNQTKNTKTNNETIDTDTDTDTTQITSTPGVGSHMLNMDSGDGGDITETDDDGDMEASRLLLSHDNEPFADQLDEDEDIHDATISRSSDSLLPRFISICWPFQSLTCSIDTNDDQTDDDGYCCRLHCQNLTLPSIYMYRFRYIISLFTLSRFITTTIFVVHLVLIYSTIQSLFPLAAISPYTGDGRIYYGLYSIVVIFLGISLYYTASIPTKQEDQHDPFWRQACLGCIGDDHQRDFHPNGNDMTGNITTGPQDSPIAPYLPMIHPAFPLGVASPSISHSDLHRTMGMGAIYNYNTPSMAHTTPSSSMNDNNHHSLLGKSGHGAHGAHGGIHMAHGTAIDPLGFPTPANSINQPTTHSISHQQQQFGGPSQYSSPYLSNPIDDGNSPLSRTTMSTNTVSTSYLAALFQAHSLNASTLSDKDRNSTRDNDHHNPESVTIQSPTNTQPYPLPPPPPPPPPPSLSADSLTSLPSSSSLHDPHHPYDPPVVGGHKHEGSLQAASLSHTEHTVHSMMPPNDNPSSRMQTTPQASYKSGTMRHYEITAESHTPIEPSRTSAITTTTATAPPSNPTDSPPTSDRRPNTQRPRRIIQTHSRSRPKRPAALHFAWIQHRRSFIHVLFYLTLFHVSTLWLASAPVGIYISYGDEGFHYNYMEQQTSPWYMSPSTSILPNHMDADVIPPLSHDGITYSQLQLHNNGFIIQYNPKTPVFFPFDSPTQHPLPVALAVAIVSSLGAIISFSFFLWHVYGAIQSRKHTDQQSHASNMIQIDSNDDHFNPLFTTPLRTAHRYPQFHHHQQEQQHPQNNPQQYDQLNTHNHDHSQILTLEPIPTINTPPAPPPPRTLFTIHENTVKKPSSFQLKFAQQQYELQLSSIICIAWLQRFFSFLSTSCSSLSNCIHSICSSVFTTCVFIYSASTHVFGSRIIFWCWPCFYDDSVSVSSVLSAFITLQWVRCCWYGCSKQPKDRKTRRGHPTSDSRRATATASGGAFTPLRPGQQASTKAIFSDIDSDTLDGTPTHHSILSCGGMIPRMMEIGRTACKCWCCQLSESNPHDENEYDLEAGYHDKYTYTPLQRGYQSRFYGLRDANDQDRVVSLPEIE